MALGNSSKLGLIYAFHTCISFDVSIHEYSVNKSLENLFFFFLKREGVPPQSR